VLDQKQILKVIASEKIVYQRNAIGSLKIKW
jgi:hypothetical protein